MTVSEFVPFGANGKGARMQVVGKIAERISAKDPAPRNKKGPAKAGPFL
jgi:hypothetical protein